MSWVEVKEVGGVSIGAFLRVNFTRLCLLWGLPVGSKAVLASLLCMSWLDVGTHIHICRMCESTCESISLRWDRRVPMVM